MAHRYAIYWAPPRDHPLWREGCAWLGRDPETGISLVPELPDWLAPARQATITTEPARYGWHATLKPPFRLVDGEDLGSLDAVLCGFAERQARFTLPPMAVTRLAGFLAITPSEPSPALEQLAAACVCEFDRFREKPDQAELTRRRRTGLSPRQEANLVRWGYPYVMDEFRFHLTLTARLDDGGEAERLRQYLVERFRHALAAPGFVEGVALYAEPEPGAPFTLLTRYGFD